MHNVITRARQVKLAVFDVDGVLTDGRLYFTASGEEIKAFHTLDGHGMKMLKASGVELAIVTARSSQSVAQRARNLGIDLLFQGSEDKLAVVNSLLARLSLDAAAACYMGDDVVDLPVMRRCGLAITVPDAPAVVKSHAHWVAHRAGGCGAVREACELVMLAQGTFDAQLAPYLA